MRRKTGPLFSIYRYILPDVDDAYRWLWISKKIFIKYSYLSLYLFIYLFILYIYRCIYFLLLFISRYLFASLSIVNFRHLTLDYSLLLRRFYTRRNVSGMSRRHRFFLFLHMRKSFVYSTFLKCRFRWKVGIISTFPLRTHVAFCFNQSFLCDHVNKVSHYNWLIHSPRYIMAAYFNLNNKFNMILGNQGRLVLSD